MSIFVVSVAGGWLCIGTTIALSFLSGSARLRAIRKFARVLLNGSSTITMKSMAQDDL